ncbi:MAG: dihydropteroate synthase-like protein [Candidatus Nezhaarchaeales archaeon]|nr:MAG: dihydropteroate synthase-like protein [Candidatus Nezhaarchaeota archaeon WYZ-LMO8]
MKVLLVTGRAASKIVEEYASKSGVDFEVYVMSHEVAALIPPIEIAKRLKAHGVKGFDLILIPGLISGDVSVIEKEVGIPTFKGPIHAADIPYVLSMIGKVELSKVEPACKILNLSRELREEEELRALEEELRSKAYFDIAGVPIAKGSLRIVAEVTSAPIKGVEATLAEALRYKSYGADIVDIGMVAGESKPELASKLVRTIKKEVEVAVSIDSLDPKEITAAVEAGANLVISVDSGILDDLQDLPRDVAIVVIPTDVKKGYYPTTIGDKVSALEETVDKALRMGFKKVIADPILSPPLQPSLLESLVAYYEFAKRRPNVPLMMGVGNVTELMDVDSIGINGLMAAIAAELEISLLLTTEASNKTCNCVRELCIAARMAKLSKMARKPMKDLSLSLLAIKEKRDLTLPVEKMEGCEVVKASESRMHDYDPSGYVKITIDKCRRGLLASHFKAGEVTCIIEGARAEDVYNELIKRGLVTTLSHAAYLGKELYKAELALKLGKSYVQDEELDFGFLVRS